MSCRILCKKVRHEQCNWAQYNTSISNDNVMKVLTKSEGCFCLISVTRKVTRTPPVNKSSTFQSFGRVTGDRFHKQHTRDGDRSPDVSDTTSHCFPEYAEISNHQGSHFTECAEISNHQGSHFTECTEEQNKGFALLDVRKRLRHVFASLRVRGFSNFRSR